MKHFSQTTSHPIFPCMKILIFIIVITCHQSYRSLFTELFFMLNKKRTNISATCSLDVYQLHEPANLRATQSIPNSPTSLVKILCSNLWNTFDSTPLTLHLYLSLIFRSISNYTLLSPNNQFFLTGFVLPIRRTSRCTNSVQYAVLNITTSN